MFTKYTGCPLYENQMTNYDVSQVVPEQYRWFSNKLWNMPELYDNAIPVTDSQRYVFDLSTEKDIELYVASVSHPDVIACKYKFIKQYFSQIKQDNIIIIGHKQMLDVDLLVDDNPDNLINAKYKKILLSFTWNKNFDCKKNGIIRCNNWSEIYNEVLRILDAKKQIYELCC